MAEKKKKELPQFVKNAFRIGGVAPKGQPRFLEKALQLAAENKAARAKKSGGPQ